MIKENVLIALWLGTLGLGVGLDPEAREEVEKQDTVERDDHFERTWVAATGEADHDVCHVSDDDDELRLKEFRTDH